MGSTCRKALAVVTACVLLSTLVPRSQGGEPYIPEHLRGEPYHPTDYPRHLKPVRPLGDGPMTRATAISEIEPNDTAATAQVIPLGFGDGQDTELSISCSLTSTHDVDYFRFSADHGDVIGIATEREGTHFSPVLSLRNASDVELVGNMNGTVYYYYPPDSPLPIHGDGEDSYVSLVAPSTNTYYCRVTQALGSGNYTLNIVRKRPGFEAMGGRARQILFVDFDGATIDAQAIFGQGNNPAVLSPLAAFLPNWGLSSSDEDAVIDAILAVIEENYNDLRSGPNGNRPTDGIPGHYDVDIRNSRDDPDPWGRYNVSRLIVGGTIAELGISTLGISQYIDPGNFSFDDTAVILLDIFSAPSGPDSINSLILDPSVTIIDAIGMVVGNTATHEAGHYLGNWHQENDNGLLVIMDQGGNGILDNAGVGPDGIFGTSDDIDVDFGTDDYEGSELWDGIEFTVVRTAFGLATGNGPTYVDDDNTTNIEDGSLVYPYNTVAEGQAATAVGGHVIIRGGTYPETLLLDKRIIYSNEDGTATVGD